MAIFTMEKLNARLPELISATIRASHDLNAESLVAPGAPSENAMSALPPNDAPWKALALGTRWGGDPANPDVSPKMLGWGIPADGGHNHWLRSSFSVPGEWRTLVEAGTHDVVLAMDWDSEGQSSLEAIAYIGGHAYAGLDQFHKSCVLSSELLQGSHEVLLRVYTPIPTAFGGLKLRLRDRGIAQFAAALFAIVKALPNYADSNPTKAALLARVNAAYNQLDLREGWQSPAFAHSAAAALAELRAALGQLHSEDGEYIGARRPTVLSTGHAHLDTAWLWPLWRTHQKVAHTVASALHLMDRYPEYHFSMSQPQVYNFLKNDDPELYARLKQRAAEGRFEQVGMMWIESDCNVPSGESLVRQFLYGKQFYDAEFGAAKHILWLPDVFGYSAALPQILRGCGIDVFMTTKISWNQFNRMPCDTFRWRGIDGSEVMTHFVTATDQPLKHWAEAQFYTYNGSMLPSEVFGTWNHYRQKNINDEVLYIYGYGDGGGGPTEEMLELARVMGDLPGFPRVQPGRVDQFFERVYERVWNDPELPRWVGELYLEYHRGTYTSQARTKQNNRKSELLYREAEWLNAWAHTLGGPNHQAELDEQWRTILLNQFHDILPGSSVPLVYVESAQQFAAVQHSGEQFLQQALSYVLENDDSSASTSGQPASQAQVPTKPATSSLVLINTLPWDRSDMVALPPNAGIANSQQITELDGSQKTLAEVMLPGYGYATLDSALVEEPSTEQGIPTEILDRMRLKVSKNSLENGELRLTLDANGEISSLYDLSEERELVLAGTTLNQLVTYEDRPMFWEAWDIDAFYDEKPYALREIVDWKVVEQGPLRAAIEITRRVGKSTIRQRIALTRDSRRIDFQTEVDWQERQTLLRTLFPLALNTTRATCEIQFGAVERPSHRNTSWDLARFEVCAHRWVDMSEGDYGVALLNNGKYGHSLRDTTLGISLLKSGVFPDPEADRGIHSFTYSLLPHSGDWRDAQVTQRAYELNAPVRVSTAPARLRGSSAFLELDTDHVIVETIKVAQDGDGLIIRLYECHNQRGKLQLRFARPVASAELTNMLEEALGAAEVQDGAVVLNVRPFEVKTVRVRF